MVIYARSWSGKKEPGSRVTAWDPVAAELPGLTDMTSQAYVNEVDISKVREGLALEGVSANKLRSFLTALGILFGVAAVIAMLAIGSGAKQSILEQLKLIGSAPRSSSR
ncbi:MAG: ABC transporter permease [Phaeodactylibacter sp.]|nr:ABC transporter permease [Phaeodactylibacter sp.]